MSADAVQQAVVDCGTCPVNIGCLCASGVDGWKFKCCGTTTVPVADLRDAPSDAPIMLIVDCARNRFESHRECETLSCSLCSGGALETELRGWTPEARWLPTVHAARPLGARLAAWRDALPDIRARIALDARIRERGMVKP